MAGSFNKVILMGNLTRDIELRHTSGNQAVANVGIAVNRKWKTETGEQREEVTFVDCEAWGRTAEVMSQYLSKGRPVFIEGRLRLDTWQDKTTNENRSKLKVVVDTFQFVDSRQDGGGGGGAGSGEGGSQRRSSGGGGGGGGGRSQPAQAQPMGDDDIPF
jgi:single-strand DNA-binding protein